MSWACTSRACISWACTSWACVSWACTSRACISWACISLACTSQACASFTSLPSAQDTGGESPCIDTQDGLKASDCGRLGRQAAGHPWSALRAVKSCRKDCPTASVLPKPKQQLCIQNGTRAHHLNYLQELGEAGKRSAGNRIGYQVIDRQVEDRQTDRSKQGR